MTDAFYKIISARAAFTGVVERPWGAIVTRRGKRGYDVALYGIRRDGTIIRDNDLFTWH